MAKQLYFPQGNVDQATYQELLRVAAAIDEAGNIVFELLSAAPEFPLSYHSVAADGVTWDPLSKEDGKSYIVWYNPTLPGWQEIGSGGDLDLSNYYTKEEIDGFLDGKVDDGDFGDAIDNIDQILDELTEGLQDAVDEIIAIEAEVDTVQDILTANSEDIADLITTYGDTASAASSAAAAAAAQSAAALAEAAAILAQAGAEAARDSAVIAQVAAEDAETDAGNFAAASSTSATDAAAYADDAVAAAAAAEAARIEAVAAANTAVNAAQDGVTIDVAAGALWVYETDLESWTSSNPTATWDSDGFLSQGTGTNPVLTSPAILVNGNGYREIVARIRRTAGTGWEGRVRYSTSGHGFSGTYEVVLADPFLVNGEWQIITWDFGGVSDWLASTITGIEVQLGSNSGDGTYDVDWIGVGNNIASLAQAAATHASNAAASATAAANSATAADSSSVSASSSAVGAAGSASAASTSASSAATSASSAATSASAANTDQLAAQTARSGAEAAETNAVTAENNAEAAAAQSATSATNAANSATSATNSASAAVTSANNAQTSATNSATSASAAQASQVAANSSAGNAANSASAASTSASSANTSATNAGASASAAAGSATQATTSASNASTSASQASNASTAAANASLSAGTASTNAANSAATATTQATNASASAVSAAQSASLAAQAVGAISGVNALNVVGNAGRWTSNAGTGFNPVPMTVDSRNRGGRLVPMGNFSTTGNTEFYSDPIQLDAAGIYEVRISILKNIAVGQLYVGITGETPGVISAQGIINQAASGGSTSNPYWAYANPPGAGVWQDCVFYLLGSAADVTKCPDAVLGANMTFLNGSGLKVLDTTNLVRLRFLSWGNAGQTALTFVTNIFVSRYDNKSSAEIKNEATVRATAVSAQATQINSLQATVGGFSSSITTLQQVDAGLTAKWTLQLNSNGHIAGIQVANGGASQSSIVMLTDRFAIAQPSGAGVTFPFTVGQINGVPTVGIGGNLVVDGTITSRTLGSGSLGSGSTISGATLFLEGNSDWSDSWTIPDTANMAMTFRWSFRWAWRKVYPAFMTQGRIIYRVYFYGYNDIQGWVNFATKDYDVYPQFTPVAIAPNFTTYWHTLIAQDAGVWTLAGRWRGMRMIMGVLSSELDIFGATNMNSTVSMEADSAPALAKPKRGSTIII